MHRSAHHNLAVPILSTLGPVFACLYIVLCMRLLKSCVQGAMPTDPDSCSMLQCLLLIAMQLQPDHVFGSNAGAQLEMENGTYHAEIIRAKPKSVILTSGRSGCSFGSAYWPFQASTQPKVKFYLTVIPIARPESQRFCVYTSVSRVSLPCSHIRLLRGPKSMDPSANTDPSARDSCGRCGQKGGGT